MVSFEFFHSLLQHKYGHLGVLLARSSISFWIVFKQLSYLWLRARLRQTTIFSLVSRRARYSLCLLSISFGPISTRTGIPRISRSAEFPARALVGVVYFYTDASCHDDAAYSSYAFSRTPSLLCWIGMITDLSRSDSRRQDQTAVVAVYHDDRTDHTGCHTPGGLVYIFQCVVFICILDAECSWRIRRRSCGWYRTAVPYRHASGTQLCR